MLLGIDKYYILKKKERLEKEWTLAGYVVESLNIHNFWALKMFFIEFLNHLNVIGNNYFVDIFLGGEFSFSTYRTQASFFIYNTFNQTYLKQL